MSVQCVCSVRAVCVPCACSVRAVCVQCACSVRAGHLRAKQVAVQIEREQEECRAERAAMRSASMRSLAPASAGEVGGKKVGADEPQTAAPSAVLSTSPACPAGVGLRNGGAEEDGRGGFRPVKEGAAAARGGGFGPISSARSATRASVGPEDGTGGKGEPKRRQAWLVTLLKPEHRARLAPESAELARRAVRRRA